MLYTDAAFRLCLTECYTRRTETSSIVVTSWPWGGAFVYHSHGAGGFLHCSWCLLSVET